MCRIVVVLLALTSISAKPQSGELGILRAHFAAAKPISPAAVALDVRQIESQEKEYTAKRSDGENDFELFKKRGLRIDCRVLGAQATELTIEWYFFNKDPLNAKVKLWSQGSRDLSVGSTQVSFVAESDVLRSSTSSTAIGSQRYRSTRGDVPHGWAVRVLQEGRVLKVVESSRGFIEVAKKKR